MPIRLDIALLRKNDAMPVERSLLEPALHLPDMNDLEARFAGYLDQRSALQWWHRNVAKQRYGLQGWRRHKVYPDFVFGLYQQDGQRRIVVLETKGLHLAGNADSGYKTDLPQRLSAAFRDERRHKAGELVLRGAHDEEVVCDLIVDQDWCGTLGARWLANES